MPGFASTFNIAGSFQSDDIATGTEARSNSLGQEHQVRP